ncbi:MAG: hypothetical protein NTV79_00365 [Candidatus Aureabacteria bacterium]|nr:hypothetical protein [Candidatus Auribacterota bacterium]
MSVRDAILDAPSFFAGKRVQTPAGPWYFGKLADALPRCYFQDRWVVADEEQEFTALMNYDLRATAYCRREVWHVRPFADQYPAPEPLGEAEWIEHFADLQKKNRVTAADFSDPNRMAFSVDVSQPCMLVVTDAWHPDWRVRVDGRGGEAVHRVNYLQRGVWCRPGRYQIVLEFLPSILRIGIPLTVAGLLGAFLLALSAIRPLKPGRLRGAK